MTYFTLQTVRSLLNLSWIIGKKIHKRLQTQTQKEVLGFAMVRITPQNGIGYVTFLSFAYFLVEKVVTLQTKSERSDEETSNCCT